MKKSQAIMILLAGCVSLAAPAISHGGEVPLSSLDLAKVRQGWGTAQRDRSVTSQTLSIAGRRFEHGVGTHSPGRIAVCLSGRAEKLTAFVGVDDSAGPGKGSVVFKVLADGKELWSSGLIRCGDAAKPVEVSLKGAQTLLLMVEDGGDGYEYDHADWADARIAMTEGKPVLTDPETAKHLASLKSPSRAWSLKSGSVEYRMRETEMGVDCSYFGLASGVPAELPLEYRPDLRGRVEGRDLFPGDFRAVSVKTLTAGPSRELHLVLRHRLLPLEINARYAAWGDTGVITRRITLLNRGRNVLHVESLPSLAWFLPEGDYELTTLQGGWGSERQVVTEKLGGAPKILESRSGRSTSRMSPWFCLRNEKTGLRHLAQLAWSGNWAMRFLPAGTGAAGTAPSAADGLLVEMEMLFDRAGSLLLQPGASFEIPAAAFTVTAGDLDDAANALHRYQRLFVVPPNPANDPPLVQFNSWYPFPGIMNIADMKRCVDAAADIGAEVFVLDAGWYNKSNWFREAGDWHADRKAFPNGTAELARYAHAKGLAFGIWVEIEVLGDLSEAFKRHADWCLKRDGKPILSNGHYHLDFGKPEARAWARAEMDRLIAEHQLDWVKIDYNNDIGDAFDLDDGTRPGSILYNHVRGYYSWLDEIRAAHPRLIIENCSSGGLRFDLGIIAHTQTTWISDRTLPIPSLQLAYGATLEFTPRVCNHWMVGDEEDGNVDLSKAPGWWDFMFRVPMNGQFGISSRVFDWNEPLKQRARENIALYKKLRPVIAEGDCYHLTPPPAHENPTGWMALQYVAKDRRRSVVTAYRLAGSEPNLTLQLRGLDPDRKYALTRDGKLAGEHSGDQLAREGLRVSLSDEWRSAVLELEAVP